jgi:hypothetical protein
MWHSVVYSSRTSQSSPQTVLPAKFLTAFLPYFNLWVYAILLTICSSLRLYGGESVSAPPSALRAALVPVVFPSSSGYLSQINVAACLFWRFLLQ